MNALRLLIVMLIFQSAVFPNVLNGFVPQGIAGFPFSTFILIVCAGALLLNEVNDGGYSRVHYRERVYHKWIGKATVNGTTYDVHLEEGDMTLTPTKDLPPITPPEPTRPPTAMDNVLVRLQGRVNVMSKLETAEITPENSKLYDDAVADIGKIAEEVEATPTLKESDQYNDFTQALSLANELLIDVGARFGK